ncbi:MAG TPA: DUF4340 domain-containing protein [Bryobacteraceae bacterium]|nr:DUF4340 domain-containing protein [Bryobacteraceae bacterium]
MKLTRLLIAAAILAVLGGVMWWSNRDEKAKEGKSTDTSPKILTLKEEGIQQIDIKPRTGEVTSLKKTNGRWSITAPQPMKADDSAVASITSAVSNLSADRIVDEHATDLPSYGLDPALVALTFTDASGKATVLKFGEDTPTGSDAYAVTDGDPRLYTVFTATKGMFNKGWKDLREKHLITFNTDKLSRVELDVPGKPLIEFGRSGPNDWQILKPKTMRADSFQVEQLTGKAKSTLLDPDVDPQKAAAGFASAQRVATVRITGDEGLLSIEIRKNKDDVYAKSSQVAGIYKVNKDAADDLAKNLDDFRNKKLFDFGFSDPTRIEFRDGAQGGAKTSAWDKSGDKWTSGGKNIDPVSVQNLIDKLRDVSATKFTEGVSAPPTVEITVVSDSGKRTEKVKIAASGPAFVASRDGDDSQYQLDAETVNGLRQAAADVKEDTSKPGGKK